ncbi:MAG: hypothetical protein ACE5GC_03835 [Acidimicrobiia bacterium]
MVLIGAVREVEGWTGTNIVGGLALALIVTVGLVWAIRRYLRD